MKKAESLSCKERFLHEQVAIVSGASGGIGGTIAVTLACQGAHVILQYYANKNAAEQVALRCREHGVEAITFQADLRQEDDANRFIEKAAELGRPAILVNNAGISMSQLLIDTPMESYRNLMDTNFTSAFLCTRAVLPYMLSSAYGRIVNIASVFGITGAAMESIYSASKGALITFSKALAREVAGSGITVNCVAPGAIETRMLENLDTEERSQLIAEIPMGRIGRTEDVAHACLYLVHPKSDYVTGQVLTPSGGWMI
ncbi:elongation factor P 5-aminopentanone reductase [Alicyclobacillus tolerans]|uniref:3-oxoacyl-[acyl-carrier protein] reductase n=1 Tax=Alicyclobacillus tolerans TaxID=90970 RepID=A0ABT9LVT4_9BACL|nr:glucose 1-dehydrogenase [Alicyclobacillus tengchongensis]MDP9728375.1 3-oxoacyl-[acyl-carrier protein] reductase [Alicyclobacillus tengchongensis]